MATHDTEPETECSCNDCTGNEKKDIENPELDHQEKDPLDIRASPRKKAADSKGNLLKKMQSLFNADNEVSDDDIDEENDDDSDSDDEALKPYECAICPGAKFSTVEGLGKHVENSHSKQTSSSSPSSPVKKAKKVQFKNKDITEEVIDEVTDEFANEVANIEAKSLSKSTKNPKLQTANNGTFELYNSPPSSFSSFYID